MIRAAFDHAFSSDLWFRHHSSISLVKASVSPWSIALMRGISGWSLPALFGFLHGCMKGFLAGIAAMKRARSAGAVVIGARGPVCSPVAVACAASSSAASSMRKSWGSPPSPPYRRLRTRLRL